MKKKLSAFAIGFVMLFGMILGTSPASGSAAALPAVISTYEHHGAVGAVLQTQTLNYGNCDSAGYSWLAVRGYLASSIYFNPRTVASFNRCNQLWIKNNNNLVTQWCVGWNNPWPANFTSAWNDRLKSFGVRYSSSCSTW